MSGDSSLSSSSPSLEDCLKLVRGERDEQRLAGLLLVTKFANKDDHSTIRQLYHAVSPTFLLRLLRTGMGTGATLQNRDVYLQLSLSIFAAFCRVPEIAASQDMLSKLPLIIQILSHHLQPLVIQDCYEIVFLVCTAREDGVTLFYESGGFDAVASSMCKLSGSQAELAVKLIQLMMTKLPVEEIYAQHSLQLSMVVVSLSKLFAELHTALKFEALHVLYAILSSKYASPVHSALSSKTDDAWTINMRVGIVAILQNRVATDDKLKALVLAQCILTIVGEGWLTGDTNLPGIHDDAIPADRCILVVLESTRVEVAILLNDLAHLRDESSKGSSASTDIILQKQRDLGITFSLVEKMIKILSELSEEEDSNAIISESTFMKIMKQLNETINVVLEYLQDAKEHGAKKGDDLLASVRLVGSYLAQTPEACEEKVRELLSYMLSVEGMDEPRPFYSVCFLLPMLCQITMRTDGCRTLASTGALDAVINCLVSMITTGDCKTDESTAIFLACDVIMNLLTKRGQLQISLDTAILIKLLKVLTNWTEVVDDPSVLMMASSICSMILDSTSEETLLHHPTFDNHNLISIALLIQKSLSLCGQDVMCEDAKQQADLHDIVVSAYSRWVDRFPQLRTAIEK